MYVCRECEQPLNQATELCPYCGADLTGQPLEELVAPKKKRSIAKVVIIWGVLIACLWAIVWFVLPPRPGTSKPEAEKSALAALEAAPPPLDAIPNVGQITLACVLGYRDFRFNGSWRGDHPRLVAWLDNFSARVPAFAATKPPPG